jgi:hypothetical protein
VVLRHRTFPQLSDPQLTDPQLTDPQLTDPQLTDRQITKFWKNVKLPTSQIANLSNYQLVNLSML